MNSIRQVPSRVKTKRIETNLGAEREHFDKQQVNMNTLVVAVVEFAVHSCLFRCFMITNSVSNSM